MDRLLWIAGRAELGGLPGARAAERAAESRRALGWVEKGLAAPHERPVWRARIDKLLSSGTIDDEHFGAAARVTGELGLYDFVPLLVVALDGGHGRRRMAAQEGLHALFGAWFTASEEVDPYLDAVRPGPGTELLLELGEKAQALARERLFASLRDHPEEGLRYLDDPDPRVRAGVARAIGEASTGRVLESGTTGDLAASLAALLDRLEGELDNRAFHATVEALVTSLASAPIDAPGLIQLRRILRRIARIEGDPRAPSVAWALARLPWGEGGPDRTTLVSAVDVVGDTLVSLAAADLRRGVADPDPTLMALQALQALCERAETAGEADELRRSRARQPVFDLVAEPGRVEVVRATAAATLASFALPEDAPFLILVLDQGDAAPSVSHAVLGALRTILLDFGPGPTQQQGADLVLREVAALTGAADPDLRRRALALLAEEGLAPSVERLGTDFLVERFAREEIPDLSLALIRLLRRYGEPDDLAPVVASVRFAELAGSDPLVVGELAEMVKALAFGRANASLQAAMRLVEVPREETSLLRTRHALALVAALGDDAVVELDPASHRIVCSWAWRLHVAGLDLRHATPQGARFVERLVQVHWPQSSLGYHAPDPSDGVDFFDEPARQHLLAVALGILATEPEPEVTIEQAEQAFARALKFEPVTPLPGQETVPVRRDRARFRAARGDSVKALADYRALVGQGVLEIRDLRQALELLEVVGGTTSTGRRAIAPETFDFLALIVGRPTWFTEPATVRMQDLRNLAEAAIRSGDTARMESFVATLHDLPSAPTADAPPDVPPPLWAGLASEPEGLANLLVLLDRVTVALAGQTSEG